MEPIRVTEVLNFFKEQWFIDWVHRIGRTEANRIVKSSMKTGTRVDELIKTGSVAAIKDKADIHACLAAFNKWRDIYKPMEIINGVRLNGLVEGVEVTGEPDLFVDGVLVDIKCAAKISPSYWIQVNMYRKLHGSTGPVAILRLCKNTGSYEYVVQEFNPILCDVWVGLMRAMVYFKGASYDGSPEL